MSSASSTSVNGEPADHVGDKDVTVGHPVGRSLAQLEASQDAMRSTTKWLVAAAASVGGVLVAGLSLSDLPIGGWQLGLSMGGFVLAVIGVASVIFAAARVLVSGFTSFGQLADLRDDHYTSELKEQRNHSATIRAWQRRRIQAADNARAAKFYAKPLFRARQLWAFVSEGTSRINRTLTIRRNKTEGVYVDVLVRYLNKDAFFFSNGLAADLSELWDRLSDTDLEILQLRGQKVSREQNDASSSLPTSEAANGATRREELASAEWRLARLETAAGQLIAFANQKVISRQFKHLRRAVQGGGFAIVLGVAGFAIAPHVGKAQPLTILEPTPVTVTVLDPAVLGIPGCEAGTTLAGTAVGGNWRHPLVVAGPTGSCRIGPTHLDSDGALVVPRDLDDS